jgi:hypothetical protein
MILAAGRVARRNGVKVGSSVPGILFMWERGNL